MKKRILIIVAAILVLVGGLLLLYTNSNYYYSKKLVSAIRKQDIATVQQIIEKKPTCVNTYPSITSKWWHSAMNWRICFPLNEACGTDNLDLILLLLESGADPNCNDGLTPLSITYRGKGSNWYKISQTLIEYGASLDYITEYTGDQSAILEDIVKVRSGSALPGYEPESEKEVRLAFDYALEHCDHSKVGWNFVLQACISNDRNEIVKLLLDEKYCDVNDTSIDMTPLMFAARDSTPEMVQLLLDYGADKSYVAEDGMTAYDYAVEFNTDAVASLIRGKTD